MKYYVVLRSTVSLLSMLFFCNASANQNIELQTENNSLLQITVKEAAAKALLHNPTLSAFSFEKRVKEAQTLQAGLRPTPKLQVQVENALLIQSYFLFLRYSY